MKSRPFAKLISLAFAFLWVGVLSSSLHAQSAGIDIALVIDRSASMKNNDPQNLRLIGAQQLVDLARESDTLSVWKFAQTPEIVLPPAPLRDSAQRQRVKKAIRSIDSTGTNTNITGALESVFKAMNADPKPELRRYVVLMTDGSMDLPGGAAAVEKSKAHLKEVVLPKYRSRGWPVYAIGLSGNVDGPLMTRIAVTTQTKVGQRTKGFYEKTDNAAELPEVFSRMLAQMADWVTVGESPKGHEYKLDGSIDRLAAFATFKAAGTEMELLTPDGGRVNAKNAHAEGIAWIESERYAVVKIQKPRTGVYRLQFVGKPGDSMCFAESDVWLQWQDWGKACFEQEESIPVGIRLMQGERPWEAKEAYANATVTVRLVQAGRAGQTVRLFDDGSHGDEGEGDGLFAGWLTGGKTDGSYEVEGAAEGSSFQRVTSGPPMQIKGERTVDFALDKQTYKRREPVVLTAKLLRKVTQATCSVQVMGPGGSDRLSMTGSAQDVFQRDYTGTGESGTYRFLLTLTGESQGKQVSVTKVLSARVGSPDIEVACRPGMAHGNTLKLKVTSHLDYAENLILRAGKESGPGVRLSIAGGGPPSKEVRAPLTAGSPTRATVRLISSEPFWSPHHRKVEITLSPDKIPGAYVEPSRISVDLCPGSLVHRVYLSRRGLLISGLILLALGAFLNYYSDGASYAKMLLVAGILLTVVAIVMYFS